MFLMTINSQNEKLSETSAFKLVCLLLASCEFNLSYIKVERIVSHVPTLSIKCSNVVICSVGIWRYELDIVSGCTKSSVLIQWNAANTKCS